MDHTAASENDPELGQPKPQRGHIGGCRQSSDALTEPLLSESEPVMTSNLPRSVAESVGMDKGAWESLLRDKSAWESLLRDKSAHFHEYLAELDRLMSSLAAYQEQAAAHRNTGRRMTRKVWLLTALHLLFIGAMYLAYRCGYVDGRPRSTFSYILGGEVGLYTSQVLIQIAEQWQHLKREPGEFRFKFDFENMPALKELAGEQKWKEIQACSDNIRVMEDLNAVILMHQSQAVSSPSS